MARFFERPISRKADRPRRSRLGLETLEDRLAPAVINVIGTSDGAGTVTQTKPGIFSATTLRAAVHMANTDGNTSDTIDLTLPGTYHLSLVGTANETDNAAGELAITAVNNVTIQNISGGAVTVDGGGLNRVFDINPGAQNTTPFTVTFQGLTIQHGVASPGDGAGGSGGGIRAQGAASVALNKVVLQHNTATADGGGISLESLGNVGIGTLTITNSTIANNHAGDAGGGVESDGNGTITINTSTISDNTCINQGAGVWLDAGTAALNMTGDVVEGNQALFMLGGGIGNAGSGSVTLVGCTIENNSVGSSLQMINGTPTFVPGTGAGFADAANLGSLTVTNCQFLDNVAAGNGGGIQEGGPSTTITGTVFDGNVSGGNGGGLFVNGGTVQLTNDVLRNNVAVNGGAVEADSNTFTVSFCTFDANRAQGTNAGTDGAGGAIEIQSNGTNTPNDTVANSLFLANTGNNGSTGLGGAINQVAGALTVTACQFTGNFAFLHGGAINSTAASLTLSQSTFNGNSAIFGGAVYLQAAGTFTNDTFAGNQAGNGGGAIEFINEGFMMTLLNDTIDGNAAGAVGGGLELPVVAASMLDVQSTIIAQNSAFQGPDVFSVTAIVDKGGNLIGSTSGVSGFGAGTQVGVNPKLGPLQNNGGARAGAFSDQQVVQTEALLPGSPAIGTGIASTLATDERLFASPAGGRTTPSIGAYEPQYATTATANQVFAENLSEVLLNRPAGANLAGWVKMLNHGTSPANLVLAIESTVEYRTDEVQALYQRYLQRQAKPNEVQGGVKFLGAGGTVEQLAAALAGSSEFFGLYGNNNATFLEGLDEDGLNRQASTTELVVHEQQLAGGVSRRQVAMAIFSSAEHLGDLFASEFESLLGAPSSAVGQANRISEGQHGVSDQVVLSQILGSKQDFANRS